MKYIITENRLETFITSEFDKDLTPTGGWWPHSKIKKELRGFSEWMPIYYDKDFYTDFADNDSTKFMNYSKKDKIVELEDQLYYKYESMFEDYGNQYFLNGSINIRVFP
jgi:hypothetical protein